MRFLSLGYGADFRHSRLAFHFLSVRPQSSPCMYHFLVQTSFRLGRTQRAQVRVLTQTRTFFIHLQIRMRLKGPLSIFFRICETFFENFNVSKECPFHVFDNLQQTGFPKSPKSPPFTAFGHHEIFQNEYFLT